MKMPARPAHRLASRRTSVVALLSAVVALALAGDTRFESRARAAAMPLRCDFDGDGRSDLAVGVPGDNKERGAVNVQYSTGGQLDVGAYLLRANSGVLLPGKKTPMERVGSALACGDFDDDAFADLAIGVPGQSNDTGAVIVVYGSAAGLGDKYGTVLTQDNIGLDAIAPSEKGDRFGEALAAGDFNGDTIDDLAIGAPGEDLAVPPVGGHPAGDIEDGGMVNVVFGAALQGLGSAPPSQSFFPPFLSGSAHFGAALAAGDFTFDGVDDLAIGAPWAYSSSSQKRGGQVHVLQGDAGVGLVLDGENTLHEWSFTQLTDPFDGELFGLSLAAGQFDGLRGDDLAIGAPNEHLSVPLFHVPTADDPGVGSVFVAYFAGNGLTPTSTQQFTHSPPIGDGLGDGEQFGAALAAGNFDGRHSDDLAIGAPFNVPKINQLGGVSGAVSVIFSDAASLNSATAQFFFPGDFAQGVQTAPAEAGVAIEFGAALAAGDYQGDGVADLFIGVPAWPVNGVENAGGVEIRPGVAGLGLPGPSFLLLTQALPQPGQTWAPAPNHLWFSTETAVKFYGERMGHALAR